MINLYEASINKTITNDWFYIYSHWVIGTRTLMKRNYITTKPHKTRLKESKKHSIQ